MSNNYLNKESRRDFIRNSGVALTAALAAGGTAAAPLDDTAHRLALLEDSNAVRTLQQRYFSLLEQGEAHELATLYSDDAVQQRCVYPSTQLDSRLEQTHIDVADDRQNARGRFHCRVQLGTQITGDGTLQQMARLQGTSGKNWWEHGVYEVQYVKMQGGWKISGLNYRTA